MEKVEIGKDFWLMLHALAGHLKHAPGEKAQRRRRLISAFLEFGSLGRKAALEEVQLVAAELAALERELSKVEMAKFEDGSLIASGDGQR